MSAAGLVCLHLQCLRGDIGSLGYFPHAVREHLEGVLAEVPGSREEKLAAPAYREQWQLCADLLRFIAAAGESK